jgi:hypothetical protein
MDFQAMAARGRRHTELRAQLQRQGPLYADERELLLDAADALLFDEPDASVRQTQALELLEALEAGGRRSTEETARLRDALEGCGAPSMQPDDSVLAAA